jgi:hypothetical protein
MNIVIPGNPVEYAVHVSAAQFCIPSRIMKILNRSIFPAMFVGVLLIMAFPTQPAAGQEKMEPEELITRHLEATGAAETRDSVKSRIITGDVSVTFKEPGTGQVGGRVVLASEGIKNLVGMVFDNAVNYSQEKLGYDGTDVSASYLRPGARSPLGDFLLTHKTMAKQGLIAGTLSQSWPFYDAAGRKFKIEMAGMKKINDRETYQLKFYPSGGSDLRISLFFDARTFQHVRTEYNRTVMAQIGSTPETSSRQRETRYQIIEDFSEFRKEGGLTLPHVYKILFEISSQGGSFKAEWHMNLFSFAFNERIDPASFNVDGK